MDTRDTLINAALKILEDEGEALFSTRAVCAQAKVTAPTLYHHFGNADGLLSATLERAFEQFLATKLAAMTSADPVKALRQGWDNYVGFAAAKPRLYVAMMTRFLAGGEIPAARRAYELLIAQVRAIDEAGRLAWPIEAAADHAWASANAAAFLHVTAQQRGAAPPSSSLIDDLRERAMAALLLTKEGRFE